MKKTILFVIAVSALSVFAGGANLFNPGAKDPAGAARAWTGNAKYGPWGKVNPTGSKEGKGCIEYTFGKGWLRIQGGGLTEVDPSAIYRVKVALKGREGVSFRMGVYFFDAAKKLIDVMHNASPSDPVYSLAADAKKGDKSVKLNAPVSYQHYCGLAFNAKKDGSDIPNRNVANLVRAPRKVTADTLTLERPLAADYAKGTLVRLQRRKELVFRNVKMTGDWAVFSIQTKGQRALSPSTKYIAIFLQTGFKEPETILIDAPVIEKVSAK